MSAAAIFTKKVLGMDYRVWLVMPVIWILSLALLGYRYLSKKPCAPATIKMDGKLSQGTAVRYMHQLIKFELQTEGDVNVQWKFADGTEQGLVVYHEFTREGEYNVIARVNTGNVACIYEQHVIIQSRDDLDDQEKTDFQIFPYPDKPKYSRGEVISFESERINIPATSYKWKVLETKETQTAATATFKFNNPGKYTIQLTLNNDPSQVKTKRIEIFADGLSAPVTFENPIPANGGSALGPLERLVPPEENSPVAKTTADSTKEPKGVTTAPAASNSTTREVDQEAFKELLQSVVNEEKELEDLYEFLDYKGSTMVEVNGDKNGSIPLKEFCKKMGAKKKNKRKIESLSFVKDNKNSIHRIQVKVPEKSWWWPFN